MSETRKSTHVDHFLRTERAAVTKLQKEMGVAAFRKIDGILARDLVHASKEAKLLEPFGEPAGGQGRRHRVMVSLERPSGERKMSKRSGSREDRKRAVDEMRKAGQGACRRLVERLRGQGVRVTNQFWINRSVVAELTSKQVAQLARQKDIGRITAIKLQSVICLDVSRPLIQADQVETNLGFDGTEVYVAVIDTGVDANHPALTDGSGASIVNTQQDFTGEGTGDMHGHGTHCAGVVASRDGTRRGIAPGCRIGDFKIMDQNGNSQPDWATAGIQAAVDEGVDVASNSWGWTHADGLWTDPDCSCALCDAAENAVDAGVVFVVAAGNEDNDTCSTYDTHLRCPANACGEVIAVGASDDSDALANFSSVGPTADGRAKPDVVAPGVDIASARAAGTSMASPIDANWTESSGTSMACPHVAGVAALMLHKNGSLTPARVRRILMDTAVDIGAGVNQMGAGRVDALAAVNAS